MSPDELIFLIYYRNLKNFMCFNSSKILFINVAESIEIFFPIFHLGCFKALVGLILFISFLVKFRKGPPDAVKKLFYFTYSIILD